MLEDDAQNDSIESIFEDAVFNILIRGFRSFSGEQIILEIKTLVPEFSV